MRAREVLPLFVALAACSSQTDKQLEAVKSARSVLAEWTLVEEQAAQGRAQSTYVEQMRQLARDQLETAEEGLVQRPVAAALIGKLLQGSPDAAALKQADNALKQLEDSLETA